MVRESTRAAALVFAPALLGACSLFLDFEELQGGDPIATSGGAGGSGGGASGSAGASGGGAAGDASADAPSCGSCDDSDPCTEDVCDDREGGAVCRHYTLGVIEDGLAQTAYGVAMHRVTLTANDRSFYGSMLLDREDGAGGFVLDVQTFQFGTSGADVTYVTRLRDLPALAGFEPRSALALTASNIAPFEVNAWAAVREPTSQQHVYRFRFDSVFQVQTAARPVSSSEWGDTSGLFSVPIAWRAGGEAYGAWIAPDASITVDRPGLLPVTLGAVGSPANALAPLLASDGRPAVLWFSGTTAFGQLVPQTGLAPQAAILATCSTAALPPPQPYVTYDVDTAYTSALPGINFATWTMSNFTTAFAAETQAVTVGPGQFSVKAERCEEQPAIDVFNLVNEVVVRQGEPQILYEVTVAPRRHPTKPATVQIVLQVIRIDLDLIASDPKGAFRALVPGDGLQIAEGPDDAAPSIPALAISGADRIGVAYRREAPTGQPQSATLGRYRMCFATADDLAHPRPD